MSIVQPEFAVLRGEDVPFDCQAAEFVCRILVDPHHPFTMARYFDTHWFMNASNAADAPGVPPAEWPSIHHSSGRNLLPSGPPRLAPRTGLPKFSVVEALDGSAGIEALVDAFTGQLIGQESEQGEDEGEDD
ncbi:hypothetical protein ACIQCD_18970 [Streptomyces sp. NPDC093250]|uniref:hypothetical protein n=1 Tax=unclassified Streptomyces TaxID=2593676 RepID=UPI0034263B0B